MKKRLLSAALALAMVLTLLPLSALPVSAAAITPPSQPDAITSGHGAFTPLTSGHNGLISVTWKTEGADLGTLKDGTKIVAKSAGYYYYDSGLETLYYATGGVLGNTTSAASGTWYAAPIASNGYIMSSFTLIGDITVADGAGHSPSSISVNLNNASLNLSGINDAAAAAKLSGLTITNTPVTGAANKTQGQVTLPNSWTNLTDRAITLSVTNATVTGGIKVSQGGDNTNYGITATTVNNAELSDLEVVNGPMNLKLTNQSKVGKVTVTSEKPTTASITLEDSTSGSIAVSIPTGGTINVGSTNARGTVEGDVTLTNTSSTASGGAINATNAVIGGQVVLNGIGTKLVSTNSKITGIAITGNGFPGGPILDQAKKDSATLPTVEIHGGVIDDYSTSGAIRTGYGSEQLTGAYNITIDGNAKVGAINLGNAKINVTSSQTGAITLPAGSLTVNGTGSGSGNQYAQLGKLTLGGASTQVDFRVTGQRVSVGEIDLSQKSGTGVVNAFIPAEESNTFGKIFGGKFSNRGIEGGTFTRDSTDGSGRPNEADNLSSDLWYRAGAGTTVTYYKDKDLQKLVDFYQKNHNASPFFIVPVNQNPNDANAKTIRVYDGDDLLTVIKYSTTPTDIYLPNTLNGKNITKYTQTIYDTTPKDDGGWTSGGTRSQDVTAGINYSTPIKADGTTTPQVDVKLNLQESDNSITKLTNVKSTMDGVTARLSGNAITLAGSVLKSGPITLAISTDGKPGLTDQPITVTYNPNANPVLQFGNMTTIGNGLHLSSDRTRLYMPDDSTYYTLNGSGLKVQAEKLPASQIIGYTENVDVQVKVTKSGSGWTPVRQQDVGNALTTAEETAKNSYANFKDSLAVKEALNAVVATITDSQIDGWVRQAQDAAWRAAKKTGTMTEGQRATSGYHKVYVEAFLDVTMSDFNSASTPGTFTATMVPSYRIYVKDENSPLEVPEKTANFRDVTESGTTVRQDYVVRTQSLGNLTGDAGKIVVNLDVSKYNTLPSEGASRFTVANAQAHQSGTYVYDASNGTNAVKFTITHTVNNGLGTIVVNGEQPTVHLKNFKLDANGNKDMTVTNPELEADYDTLQAAVDDVTNNGEITVDPEYKGSVAITVDGQARKFTINSNGNRTITSSSPNVVVDGTAGGNKYTVQLTRDTAVKPTEKPIPVTVASAVGGSASLSASRADEGDTITVTLTPAVNYRVGGVTVTAAVKNSTTGVTTNTTVITTAASANSWRFVVPTGATSVTVTPSFVATTNTNATVTVSNPAIGGTAATSAGNNQVAPGTPVTVTVNPASGYRTMGIYVTNAVATRTGANTFSFNVPSSTANVVVTPRFDRNNNTLFDDVWSYDYFSSAVAWAVGRGITNGDGSVYHFGTGKSCTREDMVTFLWRNAGSPIVTGVSNPFWDVQSGSYYYNAVMWAVKNGVTNGVSANQFGVGRAVTRGEAVTFLYRAAGSPAASANSGFYDVPSGAYYSKAVSWAVGKGITNGDGSTVRFNPNGYCLREQIVTFMYRNATGTRA